MTLSSPRPRRRRHGFTLVEILLAIGIFAGVVAAIYACWTAILRSAKIGNAAAAEAQRNRVAVRALEEALACVQLFAANARHYAFIADTSEEFASLSLVSRLPEAFPRSGRFGGLVMRRVTFNVEPDESGAPALVMRQAPLLFEGDVDEEENPLILARNVAFFQVEFWGPRSREWEREWLLTNQLPRCLRFALAIQRPHQAQVDPSEFYTREITFPVPSVPMGAPGTGVPPPGTPGLNPTNRPGVRPDLPPGGLFPNAQPGPPPGGRTVGPRGG